MRTRSVWLVAAAVVTLAALVGVAFVDLPLALSLGALALLGVGLLATAWLLRLAWRKLLWRVGRRLAFSYLLVGVLPVPLVGLLALLGLYFLGGFFLGHVYRDATSALAGELTVAAERELVAFELGRLRPPPDSPIEGPVFAYYRDGHRVAGDSRAPLDWPAWLPSQASSTLADGRPTGSPFVALDSGELALAATAARGTRAVLALRTGDLGSALAPRIGGLVQLFRADDPRRRRVTVVEIGGRRLALQQVRFGTTAAERAEFFRRFPLAAPKAAFVDEPRLSWLELSPPLRRLADGSESVPYVAGALVTSPARLLDHLRSGKGEVDTTTWLAFVAVAAVLVDIWVVAAAIALGLIFGLSRAVNRLSRATDAVRTGDFTARIAVSRRDQLGELQRSFNEMTAHLGELVQTAAQKEALDKELALARQLQQDLLPREAVRLPGAQFSTYFEPSAAIGGDYFDILRAGERTLAIVIADVSGHGLPAGLRMAMIKAALRILVENGEDPPETLRRLGELVRSERARHTFVTATLALFDVDSGRLRLTNAGHPPCYLLRGGAVEEIALPSPPLGLLDGKFATRELILHPGDAVVFLSDGLIEARNGEGEPLGYERAALALAGPSANVEAVRDRLLAAVQAHAGGEPAEDDRTVVVLGYRPELAPSVSRS